MQELEQRIQVNYFHIYNRGINSCNRFNEVSDYEHFFELFERYISPIADTYAWVLMPNHFHFLVSIKENIIYKYSNADRSIDAVRFEEHKWETINLPLPDLSACVAPDSVMANTSHENIKIPKPHLHFSHFFNAYSSYFNKRQIRHGSLFERPFKRKLIDNEKYLKNVILYIHNNPVHHGFCEHPLEYPWSSYLSSISADPTMIMREKVINWFGSEENFKSAHNSETEIKWMEDWLEI
jgi:REP element-mobilizing transposase RayT